MHIKAPDTYPYSVSQLRADNPQISFPTAPSDTLLAEYGVFPVSPTAQPTYDAATQKLAEGTPTESQGRWVQVWEVVALTAEELAERAEQLRMERQAAYQAEADPLYFKWQAGEGTQEAWVAKRAEIKARYPGA